MIRLLFIVLLFSQITFGQTVGVVLSGGGATGFSHIGVLKALEEHHIKIDYISGTSAGALIAGMYAAGYSPKEMEIMATSKNFQLMVSGLIEEKYNYYYKQKEIDASWLTLKMNKDSLLSTSLPTNLIKPILTDFEMMRMLSAASSVAKNNFDSLFVPFRCVASDINAQESVNFSSGHLSQAVRASMTYPFYLTPIKIDGTLLFDGGLYNNFPVDLIDQTFKPDFIIGSNVSGNTSPAQEGNLLSQIKNMIISPSKFEVPKERGIMIEPKVSQIGTFDFDQIKQAIQEGYDAAHVLLDSIQNMGVPIDYSDITLKRKQFRSNFKPLVFKNIHITGLNKNQTIYAKKLLTRGKKELNIHEFKKRYFKLALDDKIEFIYPTAHYNDTLDGYDLTIYVKKAKDFNFDLGGNFSSRPINTGYLGFEYNYFGKFGVKVRANSYFGKYYGAAYAGLRLDFPTYIPFYIEPYYALNRWDYFKSFATFFEESKPSFIVNREQFGGLKLGFASGNRSKIEFNILYADLSYRYYQVENFNSTDTADVTNFYPITGKIKYERSTLNHKQYPSKGTYLTLNANVLSGNEVTKPGSTLSERDTTYDSHQWVYARVNYKNYFKKLGPFSFGFELEGVFSTQKFFENYTASILASPVFRPIPEMKTLFQPQFSAYQYTAGGLEAICALSKNIELRTGAYYFQPVWSIIRSADRKAEVGPYFDEGTMSAYGALVYHSPIGPLSLNFNYYDKGKDKILVSLNFGYILQNQSAIR